MSAEGFLHSADKRDREYQPPKAEVNADPEYQMPVDKLVERHQVCERELAAERALREQAEHNFGVLTRARGRLLARVAWLEQALARAAFVAEHLHGMIPREVWRDSGGDDSQGHYEGDYHAERVAAEIKEWAALGVAETKQEPPR